MKDETTITLPVSNRAGIVTVEDLLAEIGRRFNTEKDLKNAAFAFLVDRGRIWSSITVCTIQRSTKGRQ